MTRFAVVLAFALLACSKSKPADQKAGSATATQPSVPVAADAAAAMEGSGSAAGGSAAGSAAMEGSGSAAAPDSGSGTAAFDFDKLSRDEKMKFMKTKVVPTMKPLFQKFDPKDYANFGCKTCHGKDPQKSKYKMPNPELKPLDFDAIKAGKEDPKFVEFMTKTVRPEMAKTLGMPEMSQAAPDGFGCLDCHTLKKKKK